MPPFIPSTRSPLKAFSSDLDSVRCEFSPGLVGAILQVRRLLKRGNFHGVFTTGGYIAAPAILAARSLGLPVILHESNVFPGKVTRWFSPFCTKVAIGFEATAQYLPRAKTVVAGTPVRSQFLTREPLNLPIPDSVPVILVMGGSQGAVAVNQLVRQCRTPLGLMRALG